MSIGRSTKNKLMTLVNSLVFEIEDILLIDNIEYGFHDLVLDEQIDLNFIPGIFYRFFHEN